MVASSSRSRGHNFPRSPRFERLLVVRSYRREITADRGYALMALINHAREKARLQRQLEHHGERVRDLEARVQEYEELVQAGVECVAEHSLDLAYLAYRERYLANPYMDENAYVDYCWSETLANPVTDGATHHQVAVQASGGQSCKDDIAATTERTANDESRNTPPA